MNTKCTLLGALRTRTNLLRYWITNVYEKFFGHAGKILPQIVNNVG